jgi:hypothetical protein
VRFERDEAAALQPLKGHPPFRQMRELVRRVQVDCTIQIDDNSYSVPWRLIGESVHATVTEGRVCIHHRGAEVAVHPEVAGRRQRVRDLRHFHGVAGVAPPASASVAAAEPALLRPLAEYERAIGGGWS